MTYAVSRELHKENRERLVAEMRTNGVTSGVALLQGGTDHFRDDTDEMELFRQESFFHWAFGVHLADWFGAVDIASGEATLFMPRLPESFATWMGPIRSPEEFQAEFGTEHVRYVDEMPAALKAMGGPLHTLAGVNTDSGTAIVPVQFEGLEAFTVESDKLYAAMVELRSIKTLRELELMRHINGVSSAAHVALMRKLRPGMGEFQAEALFQHHCYFEGGFRKMSYLCIGASGENCAVLHYGAANEPNARRIEDGDMCLFDFGGEYYCYASDITCSFPANGTFSDRQRAVYQIVLDAQKAVMAAMRPGVQWVDMHLLSHRVIVEGLMAMGLVKGTAADAKALVDAGIGALFMPHGLGHMMGLDTHDVGGFPSGTARSELPHVKALRAAVTLRERMVLTVEPGIYFIPAILEPAFQNPSFAPHLEEAKIRAFFGFGGVRLEDDVIVTADGIENMTKCPREVADVEAVMAGAAWP